MLFRSIVQKNFGGVSKPSPTKGGRIKTGKEKIEENKREQNVRLGFTNKKRDPRAPVIKQKTINRNCNYSMRRGTGLR